MRSSGLSKLAMASSSEVDDNVAVKYLFRLPTTRKTSVPKVIPTHIGALQADVMYLKAYGVWSGGYTYCLNVIDEYSRYAWSFPLKKLRKGDVKKLIVSVVDELVDVWDVDKDTISLTTDQGTEFHHVAGEHTVESEVVEAFDVTLPIPHTVVSPAMGKGRTALVERLNRTLHEMLRKRRFLDPDNRAGSVFVAYVSECVEVYNNKRHSTLKATPREVLGRVELPAIVEQNDVPVFNVGDAVLVRKSMGKFDKRSAATRWDPKLWRVTGQIGWRYTLEGWDGVGEFEDTYGYIPLGNELQLVQPRDVDRYLAYEKPTREKVARVDEADVERRRQRRVRTAQQETRYVSNTQRESMIPASSSRKERVEYGVYK